MDDPHHVAPFEVHAGGSEAFEELVQVVSSLPRARIVERTDHYFRAEVRSRIFRFVDDVELHFRPEAGIVAVRSASRIGRGDLGVNRRRVETIRARWQRRRATTRAPS